MSDNPVERAARAIIRAKGFDPDNIGMIKVSDFYPEARAAIASLRAPTPEMLEVMISARSKARERWERMPTPDVIGWDAAAAWARYAATAMLQAAIDAALSCAAGRL